MHAPSSTGLWAAQYVRKSTEHQKYSLDFQKAAIADYAAHRGIKVVESYVDAGRSGLKVSGRPALARMLDDVISGRAAFNVILVYDVSRWGRFQDADESAYYEFACKRAGVAVHYCAEPFSQADPILSSILKNLKRAMAAEYSRELSHKTYAGAKCAVENGVRPGSPGGYGLRRAVVSRDNQVRRVLAPGERKHLLGEHTILVPGPPHEVDDVKAIFRRFVNQKQSIAGIAYFLTRRFARTGLGQRWTYARVRRVLINPKYVGDNVWNRSTGRLKAAATANPPDRWIRGASFRAIVGRATFDKAQAILAAQRRRPTDDELLSALRELLNEKGGLSAALIDRAKTLPSAEVVQRRFQSLDEVYRRLDCDRPTRRSALRELHRATARRARASLERDGAKVRVKAGAYLSFVIEDRTTLHVAMVRCRYTRAGPRWRIWKNQRRAKGYVLMIRMGLAVDAPAALYLLPPRSISALPAVDFGEQELNLLTPYRLKGVGALRRTQFSVADAGP